MSEKKVRVIVTPALPGAPGASGREVELRTNATHVQWRYVGALTWTDLVPLSELQGPQGEPGPPGGAVVEYPAGENLSAGDLVYVNGSGQVLKADANAEAKAAVGYVLTSITSGQTGTVYFEGTISGLSSLTPGARYFLSASVTGGIATTAPSGAGDIVQVVGYATSATELSFSPGTPIVRA